MLFPLFGLPKFCRQGNREKGVGRGDFRWLGIVVSTTLLSNHLMTTREEAMETLEKEQAGHVDSVFSLCVGSLLTDDLRLHTDTHTGFGRTARSGIQAISFCGGRTVYLCPLLSTGTDEVIARVHSALVQTIGRRVPAAAAGQTERREKSIHRSSLPASVYECPPNPAAHYHCPFIYLF